MMIVAALIVAVILLLCFTKREKFVEMFGFSGYTKPTLDVGINYGSSVADTFVLQKGAITPDMIQKAVLPTQAFVKEKTGLCVRVIETNKFERYLNEKNQELFKCRFMMTTTSVGFPFGLGIQVEVLNGKVVSAQTQPLKAEVSFKPYQAELGEFTSYNEILKK